MTAQNSAVACTFFFSSLASSSYVLCHFISPCNCDSDERLDAIDLSELVSELPVAVVRGLWWRTLCIIFKSLPSSIISCVIHVRTFRVSCWDKESGSRMSRKAA